jgi:hypothetical protein
VKPRTAHYNSRNLLDLDTVKRITGVILELIRALKPRPLGRGAFIRRKLMCRFGGAVVRRDNSADRGRKAATCLSSVCPINLCR